MLSVGLLIAVCAMAAEESMRPGPAPDGATRTPVQIGDAGRAQTGESARAPKAVGKDPRGAARSDGSARPPKIVVVVSKKNPIQTLKTAELRRVFLRQKTQWPNGWMITVYERSGKSPIGSRFSKSLFHKKPEDLREYWMNLQLTRALKPPKVLRSAKLVKQYLRRVKGGIGYLYEHELDDTVKAIEIDQGKDHRAERRG